MNMLLGPYEKPSMANSFLQIIVHAQWPGMWDFYDLIPVYFSSLFPTSSIPVLFTPTKPNPVGVLPPLCFCSCHPRLHITTKWEFIPRQWSHYKSLSRVDINSHLVVMCRVNYIKEIAEEENQLGNWSKREKTVV